MRHTPPSRRPLSDAELDVLKTLWDEGPGTVHQIRRRLQALGQSWAYTTVLTLLQRLQGKGYTRSHREDRASVYHPVVSRQDYLGQRLGHLASQVCEGSTAPLLLALVEGGRFSPDDISELRRLLERLANENRTGGRHR
jgi:predicted transcriptional regulator